MIGTHDGYWFSIGPPNQAGDVLLEVFHYETPVASTPCRHIMVPDAFDTIIEAHRSAKRQPFPGEAHG